MSWCSDIWCSEKELLINWLINPLECYFGFEGLAALDRYLGQAHNTLLLQLIPADLDSAFSQRQFHTKRVLLHSRAALLNSYTNACVLSKEAVLYHFYDGLWYDPAKV